MKWGFKRTEKVGKLDFLKSSEDIISIDSLSLRFLTYVIGTANSHSTIQHTQTLSKKLREREWKEWIEDTWQRGSGWRCERFRRKQGERPCERTCHRRHWIAFPSPRAALSFSAAPPPPISLSDSRSPSLLLLFLWDFF